MARTKEDDERLNGRNKYKNAVVKLFVADGVEVGHLEAGDAAFERALPRHARRRPLDVSSPHQATRVCVPCGKIRAVSRGHGA